MATGLTGTVFRKCFRANSHKAALIISRNYQPRFVNTRLKDAVPGVPTRKRLSMVKVFSCIGLGMFIGQSIAKRLAALLEETELFVPEDDDD